MRAHKKKEADKEFSFAVAGTITLRISVMVQTLEEAVEKAQHEEKTNGGSGSD